MSLSSGTRNVLKLAGSWCCAGAIAWGGITYSEEIRQALGLKLSDEDLQRVAEAAKPVQKPAEPEVRTIIKYVERPRDDRERSAATAETAKPKRQSRISQAVELYRRNDGHYHAEAYVNGRPIKTLVDTGASLVALSYEDARAAGISVSDADFRFFSQTANGRARYAAVTLDNVRIGDVVLNNVQASVSEPGRLNVTLLGMSFLGRVRTQMQDGVLIIEQ